MDKATATLETLYRAIITGEFNCSYCEDLTEIEWLEYYLTLRIVKDFLEKKDNGKIKD